MKKNTIFVVFDAKKGGSSLLSFALKSIFLVPPPMGERRFPPWGPPWGSGGKNFKTKGTRDLDSGSNELSTNSLA